MTNARSGQLLARIRKFLLSLEVSPDQGQLLLAFSGGMDSVVLSELLVRSKYNFSLAHCNFQLRGDASDADENFVLQYAEKRGLKVFSRKFDTLKYSEENKLSIQEVARNLRYEWFEELCQKHQFDYLLTAHQLDDSIETFFINLFRGTGIQGLSGIPAVRGKIIRPLSGISREEIAAFASAEKLSWREDASNASEDYLRNRIRHELIPLAASLRPGFRSAMDRNFDHLQFAAQIYDQTMEAYARKYIKTKDGEEISVDLNEIRKNEKPEILLAALLHYKGIPFTEVDQILSVAQSGKKFYCADYEMLVDRQTLIIRKYHKEVSGELMVNSGDRLVQAGAQKLELVLTPGNLDSLGGMSSRELVVDADKIQFPLQLRPWREGDRFYPMGMQQSRKLSDYFSDLKLSRFEKENCWVLLTGADIICILDHRIDDRFKLSATTKNILRLTLLPEE